MSEYIIGAHILESLTTGMYQDSRMIFREYIQNSCDAVDAAVRLGLLEAGEDDIRITIDSVARKIIIEDNGTGIMSEDFARVLGNVADSDKRQDENRGFRGIGRLGGMAYCETLIFTAKFKGENVVSKLVCNAKILKEFLHENDTGIKRYTALQVLDFINEFKTETTEDIDAHYFRVELEGINEENTDLLDVQKVREYLSFTAPLPYPMAFMTFSPLIKQHAENLGLKIDEYNIYVNNEQLLKGYTRTFNTGRGKGSDEIFDIRFYDFKSIDNRLIAWLWFGISNFKGVIDDKCPMRGIRVRKDNIQIGNEDTLQKFFSESRGVHYFVGELFCVSKELIPNSHRDYFNENPERAEFERQIKNYCRELTRYYREGSNLSSTWRKIDEAEKRHAEISGKFRTGSLTDKQDRETAREELHKAEDDVERARAELNKIKTSGSAVIQRIIEHAEDERANTTEQEREIIPPSNIPAEKRYTPKEQRLLDKIYAIIRKRLEPSSASKLIAEIEDSLK